MVMSQSPRGLELAPFPHLASSSRSKHWSDKHWMAECLGIRFKCLVLFFDYLFRKFNSHLQGIDYLAHRESLNFNQVWWLSKMNF